MTRGKLQESFERENEDMIKLGIENAEHIRQATSWCKHFRIEMTSSGLLAQMSRLPIGSHAISCQYAESSHESMNLPWIIPAFIVENCVECPHHSPNGDTSWGERIIREHAQQLQEREQVQQVQENQLKELRTQLRELSNQARQVSELDERQILVFVEGIFANDEATQKENAELLIKAAQIGADLFSPVAVDILLAQSLSEEFGVLCLPVCGELAKRRADLSIRLKDVAFTALERGIHLELVASVLVQLNDKVDYPLPDDLVMNVIGYQQHYGFFGGWHDESPKYPNSNALLIQCYDADAKSVIDPLKALLKRDDKRIRLNTCGVIKFLQDARPKIGIDLLPDLVTSLELYDDPYEESADAKARQRISAAFQYMPEHVDQYLVSQMFNRRPAVQQEIVSVYHNLIWGIADSENDNLPSETAKLAIESAIKRCWEFAQNSQLSLEVRHEAAEVLERICSKCPVNMLPYFDSLLGYYALTCIQKEPPDPIPGVILLGQDTSKKALAPLEELTRRQTWSFFKSKLLDSIKNLAENKPEVVGETIIRTFNASYTGVDEEFKSALVDLLGEVGKSYSFQPRILPLLMKALMDYDSQVIRASAIRAIERMYRYSKTAPPKNLVDVLVLHLHDPYVIVHMAAVRLFQWKARWLNKQQAVEALTAMIGLLKAYRNKPYDLDDICPVIMQIASHHPDLKNVAIKHVLSVLPTNEWLVDEKLMESLTRYVRPDESVAALVAKKVIWSLATYTRDRYNQYSFSARATMFEWLHQIPHVTYMRLKPVLLGAAKQVAAKDAWESCLFASLFAKHADYAGEEAILKTAADSLNGERRYEKFQKRLHNLQIVAAANARLQEQDPLTAKQLLSQVVELEQ